MNEGGKNLKALLLAGFLSAAKEKKGGEAKKGKEGFDGLLVFPRLAKSAKTIFSALRQTMIF